MNEEEETKAMSRLLTRGAKMLQKGCDDCGKPLFRYQGEVVCPVCNERRGVEEETEDGDRAREGADSTGAKDTAENDEVETSYEEGARERVAAEGVDEHLRVLSKRLARDAAEHSDDPEAVERRLEALERTLEILRR